MGSVEIDVGGFHRQTPTRRHRVSRIQHQVHQHLFELSAVGADGAQPGGQNRHQVHVLADQPAEHRAHVGDQGVQVEHDRLQHLLAAEGEQLLGEHRRPLPAFDDLLHVAAARVLGTQGFRSQSPHSRGSRSADC